MGPTFPPLPPATVAFAESGLSMLVGTCGVDLAPDCVRAAGVRIWPDACRLTVLVPHATSATSIANVRANPRLALTLSQIPSHTTIQIKGKVLDVRAGDAADHDLATRYRVELADALARIGQLPRNGLRLHVWPAWAIDLEIETVFEQTPGPSAGERMPLPPGRA